MPQSTHLSLLAVASWLAACGGSNDVPRPSAAAATIIDTDNAVAVAGRSMNAAFQSGGYGGHTGAGDFVAFSNGGFSKPAAAGGPFSQVPVGPETTLCAVSGSTTITGEIANPLTISPGDFIDIDWDECDDGVGVIIDGLMGTTFTKFEGDLQSGRTLLGMALRIEGFQATAEAGFSGAEGEISVTLDTRIESISKATCSGTRFSVANSTSEDTLLDFSSTTIEDMSMLPSLVTTEASGIVESTQFDGAVSYQTPVSFEAFGAAYPHTGELLVTGANDATLRLVALDEVNVRMFADYDGDGAMDQTIDTTWEALVPRIDIPVL